MELIGIGNYAVGFVIMAGIYSIFALGLNVHWGFTGLFNIGIAGFFAVGAYTSALLTTPPPDPAQFEDFVFGGNWAQTGFLDMGIDLWFVLALGAAGLACAAVALVIGYVTLRLNDDYLAIATLGIAEAVRLFFLNEKWAANGSKGLYRIPGISGRPEFAGPVRLPVSCRDTGCAGRTVSGRAAGGEFALGPSAQGDPGGRDRGRGERQERVQFQAPVVCFRGCDNGNRGSALCPPHPIPGASHVRSFACHVRDMGDADGRRHRQ